MIRFTREPRAHYPSRRVRGPLSRQRSPTLALHTRSTSTPKEEKELPMNHSPAKQHLRFTAAAGAAALIAGSLMILSPAANAAPGDKGEGTLTIHKLMQPDGGDIGKNDGSELDLTNLTLTPLEAGFTVCEISGIDLGNAADWARIKDLQVDWTDREAAPVVTEDGTNIPITCGVEQTTVVSDGGTTEFELDADKAYLFYESTPAQGAIPASAPTVFTIPFPGNGATGSPVWNYNPHVYPKNSLVGSDATKNGEIIGDKVSFDITVPIHALEAGQTFEEFMIEDQLSSGLTYTAGTVKLTNGSGADVALTPDTDFTLTAPDDTAGQKVVLNFLSPGLTKIGENVSGSVILTIDADATSAGSTANSADITINGVKGDSPEVVDPENFWIGAHVLKMAQNKGAAENELVELPGAKFNIYAVASTTTACATEPAADATLVAEGDVSDDEGETPGRVLAEGKYCVYETEAPAGYKAAVGGSLLTVNANHATVTVVNTQIGADEGDLPNLPITGAMGNVLLVAGGAALIVAAGVLFAVRRRHANQ